jgi:integrase
MSRRAKSVRLYFRKRKRPARQGIWIIIDGNVQISTGCRHDDRPNAEKALANYIAAKHVPSFANGEPTFVPIADVLNYYANNRGPELAHPELVGFHMTPLLHYFGEKPCDWISGVTCREYVKDRMGGRLGRKVTSGTARRELETLSASLNFAYREKRLKLPVPVSFPKKAPSRQRWLTRPEAAALLAAALGFEALLWDIETRRPIMWKRIAKPQYHIARFILLALYTGTRREAVLQLNWDPNTAGGWIDLERAVLYRRGEGEEETSKRRPPAPIADRLLPHLKRWRRLSVTRPIEYYGEPVASIKHGWHSARVRAGLDDSVTPHVLRHTCATWLLQRGVPTWEVAGYLGTSEKVIRDHYGHHAPDFLQKAKRAFSR